ncbi:hypothetical protein [Pedobacter sp. UBA5917]|uniref:hypothetical protein n=1 Tax=Pedobacter sp. UBA5917 TaxID=1947061 RepID=UPI0025E66D1A|nr:hypothetical protein [Pedobacter sp. UBA5917]
MEGLIKAFAANCNGVTFGDGKFVIDGQAAGQILANEYSPFTNESGSILSDSGNSPTNNIPAHDVITVGGSQIKNWEPFHSATSQGGGLYKHKNDKSSTRSGQTREQVSNYGNKEKGSEEYKELMGLARRYYIKNGN